MHEDRTRAATAVAAAVAALAASAVLTSPAGHADPLPAFCVTTNTVDDVCSTRLTSVTAEAVNGTITGTPVGGGAPITLAGQGDAYQKSAGFGDAAPDAVKEWDTTIENVNGLTVDPSDPAWYGNAKAQAFLPRTLNDIATRFPTDVLSVQFTPDGAQPGAYRLVSIQPIAR